MATLADNLQTPDRDAVVEGTIAITSTSQRAAGDKTLVRITLPIEVADSSYSKADVPSGDYDVMERLESDGVWATEKPYRVHVPESGTWSLRALRELYVGAPPDPSAVEALVAALGNTYAPLDGLAAKVTKPSGGTTGQTLVKAADGSITWGAVPGGTVEIPGLTPSSSLAPSTSLAPSVSGSLALGQQVAALASQVAAIESTTQSNFLPYDASAPSQYLAPSIYLAPTSIGA